ncbi:EexN family lipoprotein [Salmonella enterica]|uniref:EexN family lipoprotein n=1 Tax=Salmonella enterica TaxID=28901 RepID=UPI00281FE248|nr:EexN family lipoprotein [Salmonella enterica]EKN5804475.1 EexN family lipoprotein [Salmonella enterica subsp. enterica]EHZ7774999.1 EexN family lipoprotein [Salmonella enterica]ELB6473629.1 EexN family lipoprotein [Salmonella enterica]ELI2369107.1 EexN family lipoprotein [Salmonella enterica]
MRFFYFFIIIFSSAILLTGCDEKYSKEWYIKNHKEMISKYTECLLDNSWSDQICQNAKNAMNHESTKPDVIQGKKEAFKKLGEKIDSQPVPDLNLGS